MSNKVVISWIEIDLRPQRNARKYRACLKLPDSYRFCRHIHWSYRDEGTFFMRYTVVLEREANGGYVATVPAWPGCVSQGGTRDEVTRNIREAADLYIEDCIAAGDPVPTEAGREYLELLTTTPR